ncbi:MAG: M20 family metallopeptidase [Thermotogota bacterium]|nr:M20 family metallopeptidase [Thermotogota bacterium]
MGKELHDFRHLLHQYPEPGFEEHNTAKVILGALSSIPESFKIHRPTGTSIVVEYRISNGPFLLLRADMDGLPIKEETKIDFASKHEGWMHACGHDIHMSVLYGVIRYVAEKRPKRNILFLFQPAEEGPGGAEPIINTGFFDNYSIEKAVALHVTDDFPLGSVGIRKGVMFASPTGFDISFKGKSAHAATPHLGKDALFVATSFVQTVHNELSRVVPNEERYVFTLGKLEAGDRRNVVPSHAKIEGVYRVLDINVKDIIDKTVERLVEKISNVFDVEHELEYVLYYPTVVNDDSMVDKFHELISPSYKIFESEIKLYGEDFGFFSHKYPSLIFWLGSREGNVKKGLHTPDFLPPDQTIDHGVNIMSELIEGL